MENKCIFKDEDIKNAVHQSMINTPIMLAKTHDLIESMAQSSIKQNDTLEIHALNNKELVANMGILTKILKYVSIGFGVSMVSLVIVLGGDIAITKAVSLIKQIIF